MRVNWIVCGLSFLSLVLAGHESDRASATSATDATVLIAPATPIIDGQLQWHVELKQTYNNPFDPDQIAVDAHFNGPTALTIPAFWENDSAGKSHFTVRFAPPLSGRWTVTVSARDGRGTTISDPLTVDIKQSWGRGVIRRSEHSPNYFSLSNGESFFPVGINMAWGEEKRFESYERWIPAFAGAGGNFIRIWMSDPSMMTETTKAGLGRYDQTACAFFDRLFALAEKNGVYCMATLNNYRDLREQDNWGPCPWKLLPYAAENGGPATRPADFISDPICQRLYRQRLRYIVARYSAFTSVGCWEFFNEQAFAEVPIPPSWTIGMATYLHQIDPYNHLISTSFGGAAQPEVWQSDSIDLTQTHIYGDGKSGDSSTEVHAAAMGARQWDKPSLVAELGISPMSTDADFDQSGLATNLHNGLWAALASGASGTAMNWWWDSYVGKANLWSAYSGIAAFSRSIDFAQSSLVPLKSVEAVNKDDGQPESFSESVISAAGGWGKGHGRLITLKPNGLADNTLPRYLLGSRHPDLQTPTVIDATFGAPGEAVIRVGRASDGNILRILIDDEPIKDFLISALPGSDHIEQTARAARDERDDSHRIYQGDVHAEFRVAVPAGHHRIELRNLGSDWITLETMTLRGTRSSRFSPLEVMAMGDSKSGQIVAWLHDPQSTWKHDADGQAPRTLPPAVLRFDELNDPSNSSFEVQWWDTRTGEVMSKAIASVRDGALIVESPAITRDVAFIALPVHAKDQK